MSGVCAELLIQIIHERGGACEFGALVAEVAQLASRLKRRDGSHYSSDCGRAVKASLSNNTYASPIFRRDPARPDAWCVAERAFVHAAFADGSFLGGLKRKPLAPSPVPSPSPSPESAPIVDMSAVPPAGGFELSPEAEAKRPRLLNVT